MARRWLGRQTHGRMKPRALAETENTYGFSSIIQHGAETVLRPHVTVSSFVRITLNVAGQPGSGGQVSRSLRHPQVRQCACCCMPAPASTPASQKCRIPKPARRRHATCYPACIFETPMSAPAAAMGTQNVRAGRLTDIARRGAGRALSAQGTAAGSVVNIRLIEAGSSARAHLHSVRHVHRRAQDHLVAWL
jgi:hypothetical protein